VESIPLITSSILSKKLAEGIDALVLDVKVGRGAFMKTEADARALARSLVRVGRLTGKRVSAMLTDMSAPIGHTIGNALETAEALEVLHGEGPEDLRELTFALGGEMLRLAGIAKSKGQAERILAQSVGNGSAARKMAEVVRAQGGDARVIDEPDRLGLARHQMTVSAASDGFITGIDALELGYASMALGAGRTSAEDGVDPGAGIRLRVRIGDRVKAGDLLATLYSSKKPLLPPAAARTADSFAVGKRWAGASSRIIGTIRR
jgi:thymidine phosphorylase